MKTIKQKMFFIYPLSFIILFLTSLSLFGLFVHLNGLIYDKTIEISLSENSSPKPILLVELDQDDISDFDIKFNNIAKKLILLNPKSLIFLTNQKNNMKNIEILKDKVPIFIATPLSLISSQNNLYKPQNKDVPKHLKDLESYITLPQIEAGTYRYDFDSYDTLLGKQDSLARKVTRTFTQNYPKEIGKYYINFNNHVTLPKISFKRFLEDGLINELIEKKHIVFGLKQRDLEIGLDTPMSKDIGHISVLEYFGYSLITLLENNNIIYFDPLQEILIMIVFLLFGLFIHNILKRDVNFKTVFFGLIAVYFIAWLLLNFFHIWLPISEIIILIMTVTFAINWENNRRRKIEEVKLLFNAAEKMRERISHQTFFNSDDHWDYIANLITQMLHLNKIIFLEKISDEHRLSEIKSIGCSFDDIEEQRRDYEREPYISAINAKEPIVVSDREFFKNIQDDEIQYVVPLLYSGQVMGFWIFIINKVSPSQIISFKNIIENFSNEISTLLYQRWEWKENNKRQKKPWDDLISTVESLDTNRKIQSTLIMIEKRLNILETVINRIQNAIILYDMFGRVYHLNKNMQTLLTNIEILPFNITGEDMLSTLCELSDQKSKTIFRNALLQNEPFILEVKKTLKSGHSFLIKGVSITRDDLGNDFNDTLLFDNYGILLEIIDISSFKEQVDLKTEVIKEANKKLKHLLAPIIKEVTPTIEHPNKKLEQQIDSFIFAYNKMEDIVLQDIFFGSEEYYPVDIVPHIEKVIKSLEEFSSDAIVSIEIQKIENMGLVFVNPLTIDSILLKFVKFLITDAIQESKIIINFQEEDNNLIINMSNEGFGITNDKFQEMLFTDIEPDELIFKKVRESIKSIEKINGKVMASSSHGEGINFSIYLKRY